MPAQFNIYIKSVTATHFTAISHWNIHQKKKGLFTRDGRHAKVDEKSVWHRARMFKICTIPIHDTPTFHHILMQQNHSTWFSTRNTPGDRLGITHLHWEGGQCNSVICPCPPPPSMHRFIDWIYRLFFTQAEDLWGIWRWRIFTNTPQSRPSISLKWPWVRYSHPVADKSSCCKSSGPVTHPV